MQYLVGLLAIVAVACGPSSKEVATAKSARYQGDKLQLFAETRAVVESKYNLKKSDETTLGMETVSRWYSPEGLAVSASVDDERDLPDKSIHMGMVVTLLPDGDAWVIKVSPSLERLNKGIPKPEPLKEGDASLPGWVESRVDQLALDIHKALSKYQVKGVPQMVPAGPAEQPPAPDEPSAGSAEPAPAEGSAAEPATP